MYARVTKFQGKADTMSEMQGRLEGIASQVKAIPGVVSVYTAWKGEGAGLVFAVYESEAVATAAAENIKGIWGGLADLLAGPPEADFFDNVHQLA